MIIPSRLRRSNLFIKLASWEYWPFGIIQAPLFPYWLWLSLKARSFIFFSASNPGILMGGMLGESKFEVLSKVPDPVKPKTLLIRSPTSLQRVLEQIQLLGLKYPVIFKPDLGERGWMVKKIWSESDIVNYLKEVRIDFLVQEFVDLPLEFGVFYVRYPSEPYGRVTSIVGKEMLNVVGDGRKSLGALILESDRAKLQWNTLSATHRDRLDKIPSKGERIELVSIGNHCLGTKFLNSNNLITEKLSKSFDAISKQVEGFYFGRYDLRAASVADLEEGRVMIMELNGCGAEPAHIYNPGFSLMEACRVLFKHWSDIYRVSAENHHRGAAYLSFREARTIYKKFKSQVR
jgi:hypothetical protein